MCDPKRGLLERKGHTRPATYYLTKSVAKDLIGKVAYSSTKGIDSLRYQELVRSFLIDHESITNKDCRGLFGLGDSASSQVETSRYLKRWSAQDGFLIPDGNPPKRKYTLKRS
jgi:ATP-dependent DNA helicase RecG